MKVSRQESAHPKRIPVSSNRAPLKVANLDQSKYKARWVNDRDDRIARFLEGGYQFVNNDGKLIAGEATAGTSSMVDSRIKKPVGRGVVAYLMAIPIEFYEQDQAAKAREIDDLEDSIKRPHKARRSAVSEEVDYGRVSITSKLGGQTDETPDFTKFER